MTAGLEDAVCLARCLEASASDPRAALEAYATERLPVVHGYQQRSRDVSSRISRRGLAKTSTGLVSKNRGVAQFGSAGALGALGRRFESCRPDLNHSKGSRGFPGALFVGRAALMCAKCAQNPVVLPCPDNE